MNIFTNFDLLTVGVAIAGIGILGFAIYFNDRKSVTNQTFLFFSLVTIAWGVVNYVSYQFTSPLATLWLFRLIMFFALFQAFFLYRLFLVFPKTEVIFSRRYKYILFPVVFITALVTLTPLVFSSTVGEVVVGEVAQVTKGPGLLLFAMVAVGLVIRGIYLLIKRTKKATTDEKKPFQIILFGTLITFALIIVFNFVLPAFLSNTRFIPLGAVFIFPFIAFTAYAIYKHKLFNIKVIATASLTFVLAVVTLLEVVLAEDLSLIVFRSSVFLLVLAIGVSLIRSVLKEVEAREKIQVLAKELEVANEKLKAADMAKSEFLSIAAHQLRTPLTAIKGYISMFLEGDYGKFTKQQTTELESIFRSADRLTRLIDVFLNVSRIETGRLDIKKEPVQFMEIVEAVTKDLAQVVAKKGLKLTIQPPSEPLPLIMMDRDKIHDVTMNLVDNAIKYTPAGWVNIRIARSPSLLTFSVQDSGMGISAQDIDKLFQKFTRAEAVTRVHTGGSGLGLFIAKKIVEAHGGRIWIESEGEGKGSLFTYTLPIMPNPPAEVPTKAVEAGKDKV